MQEALGLQFGERMVQSGDAFPHFYALDLMNFGIQRNIPDAIRLGE